MSHHIQTTKIKSKKLKEHSFHLVSFRISDFKMCKIVVDKNK